MLDNPKIGSEEYFQRLYEVEEKHWWSMGMREIAAGILDANYPGVQGLKILDAGCGTGITLSWLERYSGPNRVVGIDLSWYALQFCGKRREYLLSNSSVLELPFKNDLFDLISCNDVVQHLPGDGADKISFKEFYRVLKPSGCLFLRTNSSQGMGKRKASGNGNYRRYMRDELKEKIQQAGFNILKATYANSLLSILPTAQRFLKRKQVSPDLYQGLAIRLLPANRQWLNTLLYWILKSEAWFLSKPGISSPFGQTLFFLAQKPD